MGTYSHPICIDWGPGAPPASVFIVDATRTVRTPVVTAAIAETAPDSGVYTAVVTLDTAWGTVKDWWVDADGFPSAGDGPTPVNVIMVATGPNTSGPATLDTGGGTTGTGAGNIPLDHDGAELATFYIPDTNPVGVPSATDLLQYKSGIAGISGLLIRAYLASEYDAGLRVPKGVTLTGADGRWFSPLMLFPGTYYIVSDATGDNFMASKIKAVIP
jgi:hypothetical protein